MIWSASATVRQSGFSQATCLPARRRVKVSATWWAGGVATSATSTSSSLTSSLTAAYVRTPGKSVSAALRRSREQLGELGVAQRRVRVAETAGDHPARAASGLHDRGQIAERDAHVDDDLAVRERDEGHEPVDDGELARD